MCHSMLDETVIPPGDDGRLGLMTTGEIIGQELILRRTSKGWTQEQAAAEAGVHVRTLKELEAGKGNPNLATLESLAKAYGVTLAAIFVHWVRGAEKAPASIINKKVDVLMTSPLADSLAIVVNAMFNDLKR